jgi:hypothetical protein
MIRTCFFFLAVVGLSAAPETGKVTSVSEDGWAKIVPPQGEAVFLRRFSEGDRKVGWVGRIIRYEVVIEGKEARHIGQIFDVRVDHWENFTLYGDPALHA